MVDEPICTDVEISVSAGGSVQIVKFNLRNDFGLTYTERYSVPAGWTAEHLEAWKERKRQEIQSKVETFAQAEQDALLEVCDWYESPAEADKL